MSITVIVCTYNRCQMLAKALQSIAESKVPESEDWEVLVVDNNSTDQTREVVEGYCERCPGHFRYLFEPAQGKSFALNSGIRESRGELLAFTDDDVVVEADWLWNLVSPLRTKEWSGTAGRVIPVWNQPLPRWLAPDELLLAGPFVAMDLGPVPVALTQAPVGANMAFRKDMFERYGGFRTDLGRVGDSLRSGEDTEFAQRILDNGARIRYQPDAVVYHPVPENRLRRDYLLSWNFCHGRFDLTQSILREAKWIVAGVPLYLLRRLARWGMQWLFTVSPSKRFACKLNLWMNIGVVAGCYEWPRTPRHICKHPALSVQRKQEAGRSPAEQRDEVEDGIRQERRDQIFITVIVCTYNRCHLLAKALESIAESKVPESVQWEVLVVDNNSTDVTREVVGRYRERYPGRFRYVLEPGQGLSHARNAGIRESRGEVLAFTDDDVVVETTWLWNLVSPLKSEELAGCGGRIIPVWNQPLPRWLALDALLLAGPFVALDLGPVPVALTQAPVGANMAFRKDMFERYGGFRTDLGRVGDSLRSGEDTEFAQRLLDHGAQIQYQPEAVVRHPVPENRLRKDYLLSWYFCHGRFDLTQSILREAKWVVAGVPLYLLRRLARWSVQWLLTVNPSKRFVCRLNLWTIVGTVVGCHEWSRKPTEDGAATTVRFPLREQSTDTAKSERAPEIETADL